MARDIGIHVVQQPDVVSREHLVGWSRCQHTALFQQHHGPAQARREVEVMRGYRDRNWHARLELAQQPSKLELIREIQRDGRLVEQQDAVTLGGRDLSKRRRDDHALLFPPAQRVERSIFERQRSGRRQRLARDREVGRALDLEGSEMRIPAHHHDFENRVVEREVGFLWYHGHAPCQCAARDGRQVGCLEQDLTAHRPQRARQRSKQRCFARSVRAENPEKSSCGKCDGHLPQDRRGVITEADALRPEKIRHCLQKPARIPARTARPSAG